LDRWLMLASLRRDGEELDYEIKVCEKKPPLKIMGNSPLHSPDPSFHHGRYGRESLARSQRGRRLRLDIA